MTRYFFHLHECGTSTLDPEGRELASLQAAHDAAVGDARAIMCAELSDGALCLSCHIDIMDEDGRCLERLLFKDVVRVTGA